MVKIPLPVDTMPIVVDLDGTLVCADTLTENIRHIVKGKGVHYMAVVMWWWLSKGRNYLKHIVSKTAGDIVEGRGHPLPLRAPLVEWLKARKAEGRTLVLATAAPMDVAKAVADHVGIFDDVMASEPGHNLKGSNKAAALVERFPDGFMYIGDSRADHAVWEHAKAVGLAGKGVKFRKRYEAKELHVFDDGHPPALKVWVKALRVHQWIKNSLVFVPLLMGGLALEPTAWVLAGMAFLGLSLLASATYLLNDMWDVPDDRSHWSKKNRPIASGALGTVPAIVAMGILGFVGMFIGGLLGTGMFLMLLAYLVTTLTYSFWGKQQALLDVTFLAGLFTLRLGIGATAVGVVLSPWLGVFSMFVFLSLSLAKRHTELLRAVAKGKVGMVRGYMPKEDEVLTLGLGVGSMFGAVMVMVLYLSEEAMPAGMYHSPQWLWLWPLVVWLGLARIWLLAHRGLMEDDPIVFALKDWGCRAMGVAVVVAYGLALLG